MSSPNTPPDEIQAGSKTGGVFGGFSLNSIEQVAKTTGLLGVLFYAVGLIVSNEYLMQYGVSDFASFHPKNVITGVWVFLMFFAASLPGVATNFALYRLKPKETWQKIILSAMTLGIGTYFGYMLAGFVLLAVSLPGYTLIKPEDLSLIPKMLLASFVVLGFGPLWTVRDDVYHSQVVMSGLFACFAFMAITGDLSHTLYPRLPQGIGGGKPVEAELFLDEKASKVWTRSELPIAENSDVFRTQSVSIVYQTENELVVNAYRNKESNGRPRTIILDRKTVLGMLLVDEVLQKYLQQHSPPPPLPNSPPSPSPPR